MNYTELTHSDPKRSNTEPNLETQVDLQPKCQKKSQFSLYIPFPFPSLFFPFPVLSSLPFGFPPGKGREREKKGRRRKGEERREGEGNRRGNSFTSVLFLFLCHFVVLHLFFFAFPSPPISSMPFPSPFPSSFSLPFHLLLLTC